jgi:hypothetical protein
MATAKVMKFPTSKVKAKKGSLKTGKSLFATRNKKIQELLEDSNQDGAISLAKKLMLQTVIDIIPLAETVIRESETARGVYGFNALISQARELIADLEASRDQQDLVNKILVNIIQPLLITHTQQMIDIHYRLKKSLADSIKPGTRKRVSTEVDDAAKALALHMGEMFKLMDERIRKEMVD